MKQKINIKNITVTEIQARVESLRLGISQDETTARLIEFESNGGKVIWSGIKKCQSK